VKQPHSRPGVKASPSAFRLLSGDIRLRRRARIGLYRSVLDDDNALSLLPIDDDGLDESLFNAWRLSIG